METVDPTNPDPLYDLHQAATYLTISERTVRRLVDAGQLETVRLTTRKLRVRRSELERFVAASSTPARPR